MAQVIAFQKALSEKDDQEHGSFAVRDDDGNLKDIVDWSGEDWSQLIEEVFAEMAVRIHCTKYDLLADFMRSILMDELEEDL